MSERKSWDVQLKKPAGSGQPARQAEAPARTRSRQSMGDVRVNTPTPSQKSSTQKVAAPSRPSPRRAAPPAQGSLKKRRKHKRTVARYVLFTFLLLILAAAFYAAWMPVFRIQEINSRGPGAESARQIAQMKLQGTYFHILPRNSVFFLPISGIRSSILDAIPEASAVSITRVSFSSLEVETTTRAEAFVWCGIAIETPYPDGTCYSTDSEGFIFKQATSVKQNIQPNSSTTPATVIEHRGQVRIFSALDKDITNGASPARAHILSYALVPNALKFVDAMRELGAPVSTLAIRGDEADLWLQGPTRITYILGHEQNAATLAASALPNLNLTDGTIEYVDLRFSGKAYIKKYGQ